MLHENFNLIHKPLLVSSFVLRFTISPGPPNRRACSIMSAGTFKSDGSDRSLVTRGNILRCGPWGVSSGTLSTMHLRGRCSWGGLASKSTAYSVRLCVLKCWVIQSYLRESRVIYVLSGPAHTGWSNGTAKAMDEVD